MKGEIMRIVTMTVILGLPIMALGQTTDQQQNQEQTNETQTTAPVKGKKTRVKEPGNADAKAQTSTNVHGQTTVKGRAQSGAYSTKSETHAKNTKQTTTVNKEEFRSRHSEVFSLGRHPKEFFVQRYGASHFRLIGNTYFVFVDGCWVAVDVDGFVYTERVICAGDPDYVVVD